MPRRNRAGKPLRHLNGKQRPRSWHHNTHAGKVQQTKLERVEPAFARAEEDRVEVERISSEHRKIVLDFEELVAGLGRVAPCALAPLPPLLL